MTSPQPETPTENALRLPTCAEGRRDSCSNQAPDLPTLPTLPTPKPHFTPDSVLPEVDTMEKGTPDGHRNFQEMMDRLANVKSYYGEFNTGNIAPGILARQEALLKEWEAREENMEMHLAGKSERMARIDTGLERLEALVRACEEALELAEQADERGDKTGGDTAGEA